MKQLSLFPEPARKPANPVQVRKTCLGCSRVFWVSAAVANSWELSSFCSRSCKASYLR